MLADRRVRRGAPCDPIQLDAGCVGGPTVLYPDPQRIQTRTSRSVASFSAARELTRVATPGTEREWVDATRALNLRDVEELVAGHRPADRPDDPSTMETRMHVLRLELEPETYAALRQARPVLEEEHGRHLDDDELIAALAHGALDGEARGQARHQIVVERCDSCKRASQHAAGARIAIDPCAVERAECDAQHVVNGRATNDIPPATARAIHLRDHGRCRIPGCRSARALEIHHIVHREHGWKPSIVRAALAELDVDGPLQRVLRAALQRCAALSA